MSRNFTVENVINKVKARLDEDDSEHFSTDFLIDCIDSAHTEVYDILVSKWENYNITTTTITLTGTIGNYALPANFYKLVRVFVVGSNGYELDRLDIAETLDFGRTCTDGYILLGNQIRILAYHGSGAVELYYVPTATLLTELEQEIDGINGWEELMILLAMKKAIMRGTTSQDVGVVESEIRRQYERLENMASARDGGQAKKVRRIQDNRYRRDRWY